MSNLLNNLNRSVSITKKLSIKVHTQTFLSAMDRVQRNALYRIGGFTRTTAKRGIRRGKGRGAPGAFPKSKTGALRNFIRFAVNPKNKTVVIGPELLGRPKSKYRPISSKAPLGRPATRMGALMFGGRERTKFGVTKTWKPRPFMQLALAKARSQSSLKRAFRSLGQ